MSNWKCSFACFFFVMAAITSPAQTSDISVQRYEVPKYPAIARTARVEGEIVLQLKLAPNGDVVDAKVLSGPPMLHQASLDAVKKWRFYCRSCKYGAAFEHRITFGFRIDLNIPFNEVHMEFGLPQRLVVTSGAVTINTLYSKVSVAM